MTENTTGAAPQTNENDYRRRLAVAKAVMWATKPLNRVTLWAARVVVEDRMRKGAMWSNLKSPPEQR